MATFNKKKVSKVSYSNLQVAGVVSEKKAVIVLFEDGSQTILNGGLFAVNNSISGITTQIAELQTKLEELNGIKVLISAIPA